MLHLGFNSYDDFEQELKSGDPTKYIFEMTSHGFPQNNLPIKNQEQADIFTEKYAKSFSSDPNLVRIYNYWLKKEYGDDVEFIEINQFFFKRRCYVMFNFRINTPMTCEELDKRFGQEGIWAAYWPVEVLEIVSNKSTPVTSSKRIEEYIKTQCKVVASSLFEEDGFFTRDDCIEYLEQPLEEMIRKEERYHLTPDSIINLRSYIEEGNVIEVDCNVNDCEFTIKDRIDMRKIRKPSDLEKYAVRLFQKFDEKYSKCIEDIEGCDKITASKTLCIQHGSTVERYRFARVDGQGDEYIGDDWFESYIVTPQGELLTWTLNGRYIPSAREFWIEDDSTPITSSNIVNTSNGDYEITPHGNGFTVQLDGDEVYFDTYEDAMNAIMDDVEQCINCSDNIDREFKAVPLRSLKKGAWFTIKPIAEPTDKQVYIKDDYDREEKKFMCGRCDDISYSTFFKGDKMVYDDSNFEY